MLKHFKTLQDDDLSDDSLEQLPNVRFYFKSKTIHGTVKNN